MTTSPSIRALLADIGPRWAQNIPAHVREVVAAYGPELARVPRTGVTLTRDLRYGDHERQCVDVFAPARSDTPRPVVVFVHGGAFVDGHRNRSPEVYANVLYYFARHGYVGVNVEYRLAPEFRYPRGTEDVAAAIAWVKREIGAFGGDPDCVFLAGHSAGAAHAASYAYDRRFHLDAGVGLRGLIVISGRVRADNGPDNPNAAKVEAYYGRDASTYDDASALTHVYPGCVPTFIAFAEYENPLIDRYCIELAARIASFERRAPRMHYARSHNHTSIVAHLNTDDDALGAEIRSFITLHANGISPPTDLQSTPV